MRDVLRRTPWYGYVIGLAVVAMSVGIAAGLYFGGSRVKQNSEEIDRVNTALLGLCALRADLDARIAQSQELLAANPEGPIFGIPRLVVVQSLNNSKRTRGSLDVLDCKGGSP